MAKAEVLNGGHGLSVQLYDQANRQLIAFFEQYLRTIFKIEQAIQEKITRTIDTVFAPVLSVKSDFQYC